MLCPTCGEDTRVLKTKESKDGSTVTRTRVCGSRDAHRFDTAERRNVYTLDRIRIRQSGSGDLSEANFTEKRLRRDVAEGVLKRLDERQVNEVVTAAIRDLESDMPRLRQELTPHENADRPGFYGCIQDTDITDAVENRLRTSPSSMAHVLYALAIRGRSDRLGRTGWRDASAVYEWLRLPGNYPDLVGAAVESAPRATDDWGATPAPAPTMVVKRDGKPEAFRPDKFEPGIRSALFGNAAAAEKAALVANWVMWGLSGQSTVTTGQLAAGVLDGLRRVDDIAYLRWSVVSKRTESVAVFVDEVRGLIVEPSPRLRGSRRPRPAEVRQRDTDC